MAAWFYSDFISIAFIFETIHGPAQRDSVQELFPLFSALHLFGRMCLGVLMARSGRGCPLLVKDLMMHYNPIFYFLIVFSYFFGVGAQTGLALIFLPLYGIALWIGNGVRGKIVATLVVTALLLWITFPSFRMSWRDEQVSRLANQGNEVCKRGLMQLPQGIAIDSLLDETGGLTGDDLIHLLASVRLRFVEVKLWPRGMLTNQNNTMNWPSLKNHGYAHLELGEAGSSDCFYYTKNPDDSFTGNLPIKPGVCLRVTYLDAPTAEMMLAGHTNKSGSGLTAWTLKKAATGVEVATVEDAFQKRIDFNNSYYDRSY